MLINLKPARIVLLICCQLFVLKPGYTEVTNSTDSLRVELSFAVEDTSKVKILFALGNQFLNGPSDSLIFYYKKALEKIDNVISEQSEKNQYSGKYYIRLKNLRFRAIIEIGIEHFFLGKYSQSLTYYSEALEIATELNDKNLISEVHGAMGIVFKNQGEYALALEHFELALSTAIELKDTSWIAACYANAGNIYRRLTNYPKALDYFLKALEVFEQKGETRRIAIGNMNIGNLYEDQQDYITALEYYSRALQLSYKTNDKKRISECLMNVGNIYANKKEYTVAREYYQKSLKINEELGYLPSHDNCYEHIGSTYEAEGDLDKALEYYTKSYELAKNENDKITLALVLGNLSNLNIKKKKYEEALELATQSLEISLETGDLQNISNGYLYLSSAWEKLGNSENALKFMKLYSSTKDSVFSTEKYKAIKDMEMKYETEKKEQQFVLASEKNQVEMLKMSRRNRLVLGISILVVLGLIIGYLLVRQRALKVKHQSVNLEQRLLRSQMNPHFIFNSLIAIQSFVYKKDPVQAGDYIAKFAELVRIILEGSRVEFVKLEKEIKMLSLYFELQNLRFENKFKYRIEIGDDLDVERISIPPMLAQPFIENAIEHGLRYKEEMGFVHVAFKKTNECIFLIIEDNGVGRIKASEMEKDKKYKSMAMAITKERLGIFRKKFNKQYAMNISDLFDEAGESNGTKVTLEIPCKS